MLTISEFSRAAGLSLKALRIYHEEGLLVPEKIDALNGYRYYGDASFRRAQAITVLKELGFSVKEMRAMLESCADDSDLSEFLKARLAEVELELSRIRSVRNRLLVFMETEKRFDAQPAFSIEERELESMIVCGIRFSGAYDSVGPRFSELFKKAGRWISGAPFSLYRDSEFKDGDADIEAAVPVKKKISVNGLSCRILEGGRAACLKHEGPYERIGESYKRLFDYLAERGLEARLPSREIYLRGPGMIVPRSPKKFLTEIQILV